LADSADADLFTVLLEPGNDRIGDRCCGELWDVELLYWPSVDDGRKRLEDANACGLQLRPQRTRQRVHGGLRRRIDGEAGDRGESDCRGDEQDATFARGIEQGQGESGHAKSSEEVDLDVFDSVQLTLRRGQRVAAEQAGVVDEEVEAAELG
jgi:hypothetical protein